MYDKQFTPGARSALRLAQAAAGELGHGYVGSEHLLLGVLQAEGPARCCLQEQSVTPEKLRMALRQLVGAGSPGLAPAQGLTPRARRIIENAAGECVRRSGGRIGTEHLLLGILKDSGATAVSVGCEAEKNRAVLRFADNGRPYDPTAKADPDITLSAEERDIGGLGIFMVKKTMDEVAYEYADGWNVLTLQKRWENHGHTK